MFERFRTRYAKFHAVINLDSVDQRDFDELKEESTRWRNRMIGVSSACALSYFYFVGPLFRNTHLGNLRDLKIQLLYTGFVLVTMGGCSLYFMGNVYDVTDRLFDKYIGDLSALDRIQENYPSAPIDQIKIRKA